MPQQNFIPLKIDKKYTKSPLAQGLTAITKSTKNYQSKFKNPSPKAKIDKYK